MLSSIVVVALFPFFLHFLNFFSLFGLWDFLNRYMIITFRLKLPLYLVLCPVKSVCCLLHSLFGWLLFPFQYPPTPPILVFCFRCLLYALSVRSCLFGLHRRAFEVTSFLCTVLVINREWCSGKKKSNLLFRSPQITHIHVHIQTKIITGNAAEQEVDNSHAKEMSSRAGIFEGRGGGLVCTAIF